MTSTSNELTSRLRRQLEAEHREIEETVSSELWRGELECSRRLAAYHRGRYCIGGRVAERTAAARVDPAAGGRPEPFSRHLRRELSGDALAVDGHLTTDRGPGGAPCRH